MAELVYGRRGREGGETVGSGRETVGGQQVHMWAHKRTWLAEGEARGRSPDGPQRCTEAVITSALMGVKASTPPVEKRWLCSFSAVLQLGKDGEQDAALMERLSESSRGDAELRLGFFCCSRHSHIVPLMHCIYVCVRRVLFCCFCFCVFFLSTY